MRFRDYFGVITDYLGQSEVIWGLVRQIGIAKFPQLGMSYQKQPAFLSNLYSDYWCEMPFFDRPVIAKAKIELHQAKRAGDHLDFRILHNGKVYDYAIVKRTEFPSKTGEVLRVVLRPNHSIQYFETDSFIFPEGSYGEGTMNTIWRGEIELIRSDQTGFEFYIPDGQFIGRYAIKFLNQDGVRTPVLLRMKEPELVHQERMKFDSNPKKVASAMLDPDYIAEEKSDGANYILRAGAKENTLVSRRLSVTGKPINRAANLFQLKYLEIPEKFHGRAIHVEIISKCQNSSVTAGLLNSNPTRSRHIQRHTENPLLAVVWDIEDSDMTYMERREFYKELAKASPRIDRRAEGYNRDRLFLKRATNPRLIRVALSNEDAGLSKPAFSTLMKHGGEGVVLKRKDGLYYKDTWLKDKAFESHEAKIVGVLPGGGKYSESMGVLLVEHPENQEVSKVGTGFTDQERDYFWENREKVIGQTILVDAHETTSGGKLRGPRYMGTHSDFVID